MDEDLVVCDGYLCGKIVPISELSTSAGAPGLLCPECIDRLNRIRGQKERQYYKGENG